MEHVSGKHIVRHDNGVESGSIYEHKLPDGLPYKVVSVCVTEGRYPENGWVVNQACRLVAWIKYTAENVYIETPEGGKVKLEEGDLVIIQPGEKYRWLADEDETGAPLIDMMVVSDPPWTPEQHKHVEE